MTTAQRGRSAEAKALRVAVMSRELFARELLTLSPNDHLTTFQQVQER